MLPIHVANNHRAQNLEKLSYSCNSDRLTLEIPFKIVE